jgi:paraquat-inducible protein B
MSKQANPTVIGGFVLGALALVVTGILLFSSAAWFKQRVAMVTYFPGSVQGLAVGAQVQFQGVRIGQVTSIKVNYVSGENGFRIPVAYDIWPDTIGAVGAGTWELDAGAFAQSLITERGLRARLEPVSLLTGQYMVSLSLGATGQPRYLGVTDGAIEIPAIESTRERVLDMLQNVSIDELAEEVTGTLKAMREILASGTIQALITHADDSVGRIGKLADTIDAEVKPLAVRVDGTLGDYARLAQTLGARVDRLADRSEAAAGELERLARHLDGKVDPLSARATAALGQTERTLATAQGMLAKGSDLRVGIDQLLQSATGAARSLRNLADYLERHPEALMQGKR